MNEITYDEMQSVLARLPEGASLSMHRCWTCHRCRERFGLTGLLEGTPLDPVIGGWHYDILWTGVDPHLGGPASRVIGLTDRAAFDAVSGLLS